MASQEGQTAPWFGALNDDKLSFVMIREVFVTEIYLNQR